MRRVVGNRAEGGRNLLPMDTDTLKALTWDLITQAASASLIEAVWNAIQARHRQNHLTPPIDGRGARELTAWKRSIASITGRPLSLKLPIQRTIVVRLLIWRPTRAAWNRAWLATALATIACLRISGGFTCRCVAFGSITSQDTASRAMRGLARYTSTSARTTGYGASITGRYGNLRTRTLTLCISCAFGWRRWTWPSTLAAASAGYPRRVAPVAYRSLRERGADNLCDSLGRIRLQRISQDVN